MAGTPDVLASTPSSSRRRQVALGLVTAAVLGAVAVALVGGDGDPPSQPAAQTDASSTSAPPSTTSSAPGIDPADRTTGSLPAPAGLPIGTAAITAAQAVADSYCDRITSWRLTIDGEDGEYLQVVALLRPAGPAYRDVALRIELTWDTDHYDWVGSRSALESCP